MFSFLTKKEKWILLIGPIALVLIILFQGWQANHWHAKAEKESLLKEQWQKSYIDLNQSVKNFAEQQAQLTQAVNALKNQNQEQTLELKNALKNHKEGSDTPIPSDIGSLLNNASH